MKSAKRHRKKFKRKQSDSFKKAAVAHDIKTYGETVLNSDLFQQAFLETHHLRGSVSDHSLNVCIIAASICRNLQRKGIAINEKDLIQAALCHDLGMVGRSDLYRNRRDSWKSHANNSASAARDLIPDLSKNAESMIRTHMWPVAGPLPRSREAFVLNISDKWASAADWVTFVTGKQFAEDIREKLLQ